MQQNNLTSLQGLLDQLSTEQLQKMLQSELEKEWPEKAAVQMLLSALEQRELENPTPLTPRERAAGERYRQRQAQIPVPVQRRNPWIRGLSAACLVIALLAFGAFVPLNANAQTLFQMIFHWSSDVLEISGSDGLDSEFIDYHFHTDNPGLQQVYDAVVELGVDFPAVPMWLPEGFKLIGCKNVNASKTTGISAVFLNEYYELSYKVALYNEEVSHEFYITNPNYEPHEYFGVTFYITHNFDRWLVIWSEKENIECSFTIDCTEDTLHRIIQSIYVREDA